MSQWNAFSHADDSYIYQGDALREHWGRLHQSEREPFPDSAYLDRLCQDNGAAKESVPEFDGDYEALADKLQQAWRLFHLGAFEEAVALGAELGVLGHCVANKATIIYADYLEKDERTRRALYEETAGRAEAATAAMPRHANSHYYRATGLGRYSQSISIVKALRRGLGGKIKDSLEQALLLDPEHPEAHMALGLYHAEIVDKIGGMAGKLTYGATRETGMAHFENALELAPNSPLVRMEYGNALLMMYGSKKLEEATQAYVEATEMAPIDAMERLVVDMANSELEEEDDEDDEEEAEEKDGK